MIRSIAIFGLLTLFASSTLYAQANRTTASSSSAVNSSRTTSSSASRSAAAGSTGSLGEFEPIQRGGFVGRSSTGTGMTGTGRSSMGMGMGMGMGMSMGMGGMGGMGLGGMNSLGMNSQSGQQSNSQSAKSTIRATAKIRFPYSRPAATQVSRNVMSRWNRIPLPEKFDGVSLNFDNGVATLTGQVATAEEKRMAEKLILLEPGVSSVQNQLEVVATEGSE